MEKPLSIKREEFIGSLVGLINSCGLPAFITADILTRVTAEVNNLAQKQAKADREAWEKSMNEGGNDDA